LLVVIFSGILTILVCLLLLLALVPVLSPATGADMADMLRAVVGPGPVAVLESASFKLQDVFNQARFQLSGDQSQFAFSSQPQDQAGPTLVPPTAPAVTVQNAPVPLSTPVIPAKVFNVVLDGPPLGWQAYGPFVDGFPAMAHALVMLDAQRSYTAIALVRIDLARLQLHMMPGNIEPAHPSGIAKAIPYLGMIPPADQSRLVVAFNGGFKQVHGHYGMLADGVTLLPPIKGMATIAVYQDGRVKIGAWGTDIVQTPDLVAFRQNCPPLMEAGEINPNLYLDNRDAWGTTGNTDITWRTGLGITSDGKYLIYAVGNGTSAATLAEGLKQAGAYSAMQLDIHQFFAHFYLYRANTDPATSASFPVIGDRLVAEMTDNPHLYLVPNPRDFFYLTTQ
jgi:Phosphodiester glycosidase